MNIKILQWNVWFKENPDNIAKTIIELNPDVVCGQEFIQNNLDDKKIDTAKYVAEKIKYHYFYKEASTWDVRPDIQSQGNAIFSKFPITDKYFKYVQDSIHNPSNASEEGRIYVEIGIQISDKKLTIGTTHLSYTPRFEITESRKREVDNLINIISNKKSNYIFTGDLNSAPDSYTIEEISKYLKSAGPDINEKTWTTKIHDKKDFYENKLNWRLDYIFTTPDIKVKSAKIINTPYSDHLPILTEIEI